VAFYYKIEANEQTYKVPNIVVRPKSVNDNDNELIKKI